MGDESPGAMIRRARQEARMKQRELADRMGVHVTTVGYWERGKFFPEQHWAALNKLLRINLRPPGAPAPEPEPEAAPLVPPEVLEVLERVYKGEPGQLAEAVRALEAIERERRQRAASPGERRAG